MTSVADYTAGFAAGAPARNAVSTRHGLSRVVLTSAVGSSASSPSMLHSGVRWLRMAMYPSRLAVSARVMLAHHRLRLAQRPLRA